MVVKIRCTQSSNGVIMELWVKVVPDSSEDQITVKDETILVFVKDRPENNRANQKVESLLSSFFGARAKIISGHKRRRKRVSVDVDEQEFYTRLRSERR